MKYLSLSTIKTVDGAGSSCYSGYLENFKVKDCETSADFNNELHFQQNQNLHRHTENLTISDGVYIIFKIKKKNNANNKKTCSQRVVHVFNLYKHIYNIHFFYCSLYITKSWVLLKMDFSISHKSTYLEHNIQ